MSTGRDSVTSFWRSMVRVGTVGIDPSFEPDRLETPRPATSYLCLRASNPPSNTSKRGFQTPRTSMSDCFALATLLWILEVNHTRVSITKFCSDGYYRVSNISQSAWLPKKSDQPAKADHHCENDDHEHGLKEAPLQGLAEQRFESIAIRFLLIEFYHHLCRGGVQWAEAIEEH